jgi:alkaline phosphatase D
MVKYENFERLLHNPIKRRNLIIGAGAFTGLAIASQFSHQRAIASGRFSDNPFKLGVASGEPYANSVVIWTRLAPEPLNGGGMPPVNVPVRWEVSTDSSMKRIVARGNEFATPELGHSVRAIVEGLQPSTWYWYRFHVGNQASRIGRTRTAPLPGSNLSKFNFALVSCQNYQQGFYTAYKYMAEDDLDLVVHVGDYIYEGGISTTGPRQHNSSEILTLADYRNRHALYKLDPNLQEAHARFPWIVTWDDHEVENNYANFISEVDTEPDQDPTIFLQRRAIAYQVYYEHMPLRPFSRPVGPDMQLYRRLSFGNLATFHVLDTRQYRTDQPCGDGTKERCPEVFDPQATILGQTQEDWLYQGLSSSQQPTWNILAQQVPIAQRDTRVGEGQTFSMDKWDAYLADRDRLMEFLDKQKPSNPVSLAGDVHNHWAMDLKADFNNLESAIVGSEFVCSSISSGGDGNDNIPSYVNPSDNPHIKFYNNRRGYARCTLTPSIWKTDYLSMSEVSTPFGTISKRASYIVENGRPGVQPA